ncbi:MAG TPA: GNAT family N-acetyltransferase [Fimbriimonadaceae bacterium]
MQLLRQVQETIAAAEYPNREIIEQPPFRVFLNRKLNVLYVNYAIPLAVSVEPLADLKALAATFKTNDRVPRLEFARELSPELQKPLQEMRFTKEQSLPMMTCTRAMFRPRSSDLQIREIGPEEDVRIYYQTANKAFDMQWPISETFIAKEEADRDTGELHIAIAYVDGEPAGCACLGPSAELSGVATVPEFRRRGIAAAVSSFLLENHFKKNELAWLAADDAAAEALYRSIGFELVGTHESWSLNG